jgi:signal transduction histidine kinase/ActR/RegA family two-component response regulator
VRKSSDNPAECFLLATPIGRDGPLTSALLARNGIRSRVCATLEELCECLERDGAAGLVIAQEVLAKNNLARLGALLQAQPAWSDIPVLLFTAPSSSSSLRDPTDRILDTLGNVTLLERPVRAITMISAARSALRTRKRQYAARAELFAQQTAVRQRDQFLAMLGHELRNPLSAISLANSLDDSQSSRNELIGRQLRHLMRLVDDLLDVSRVTMGKIVLKRERLDLRQVVESALVSARPRSAAQNITVRTERMPETPVWIDGDPVRLEQVITNLLSNAMKYSLPQGHVTVSLLRKGSQAVLQISDDGVGIAPEMLGRVFDLFMQVEGSLARSQGGLGIGLTLVRTLVGLHGGSVDVGSEGLGKGSQFSMCLPLAAAAPLEAQPAATSRPPPENKAKSRGYEVLIVEDNADNRELLALIIARLGHRVSTADDGLVGVTEALAQRPDLLLVDIGLPGLNGYEVAQQVRRELGHEVYLIAMTGYGQPEDRQRALDAGFDAHFTKPLDLKALEALLQQPRLSSVTSH